MPFLVRSPSLNRLPRRPGALLAVCLLVAGCSDAPHSTEAAALDPTPSALDATPEEPRLTSAEALQLAKDAMIQAREGLDPFDYEEPVVPEFDPEDRTWFVFFMGLPPAIGNHCAVTVNDNTREIMFVGGM